MGTPMVTLPGTFRCRRVTYACLRQLGIDAGVANSPDDYLTRALRLGTDLDWRRKVRAGIESSSSMLFADFETLRDFERQVAVAVAQDR